MDWAEARGFLASVAFLPYEASTCSLAPQHSSMIFVPRVTDIPAQETTCILESVGGTS
jgi:hypothetical protein